MKEKKIVMDTENFLLTLETIHNSTNYYIDWNIEGEGYIYKENKFGNNKFIMARSLMSCCAADTQVVGIMCNYPGASILQENDWYHVKGKIQKYTFENRILPILEVEELEKIAKPESAFVYPY